MIKPSVITYEVSDEELDFKRVYDKKSMAEVVDTNLARTKKFLNVLKKYYQLPGGSSKSSDYERTVRAKYIISAHGNFDGISIHTDSTRYDNWDGRPPISNSREEKVSRDDFFNKQMQQVIEGINKQIEACAYLSPTRSTTAMLPESIFNLAKSEISRLEGDLKVLKDYMN